jgi:hypothetical protein
LHHKDLQDIEWCWRNRKGHIDGYHVLIICVALANQRIKQKPLFTTDRKASDHTVNFDLLAEDPPNQLKEMLYDV